MKPPFPGMDPYLEDPALWPEFHRRLVACLLQFLLPRSDERYRCTIKQRRYAVATLSGAEEHEEDFIEIRERSDDRLVTLLDVVSPANKSTVEGRQAVQEQRHQARSSGASLVDIDLVLQGQPIIEYSRDGLPKWDYAVTVTRASHPERFEIYIATLQKRLPRFRLPLTSDDRDAVVDLSAVFARCYDQGDYLGRIDYSREPTVPLDEENNRWLGELLTAEGFRVQPSHEAVALAAYKLWEQEGRQHGRDKEHWYKALVELRRVKKVETKKGRSP
jgi:hypothetical protein